MLLEYKGVKPKIGKNVFIAPTAVVIGNVHIMDNVNIWYGTIVRGDRDTITIGSNTNIQDNCTVHIDPGFPVVIGHDVTVAHRAVVHGCTIEDFSLIGIGAIVLNGALVKEGSIVGSGAVVREGQVVGPYHLVAGIPAALKKELDETVIEKNLRSSRDYMKLAEAHRLSKPF
ncbi:MAG: gamma carbonic anhydrase family protein [Desulfobacterales bacterium]|jgi:carbonic anhydrase/acetyltransferase-like protein (isoleucine patch superfamily)